MSGFGTLITFKKLSGAMNEMDKEVILEKLNIAVEDGEYSSHISDRKYRELTEWEDGKYGVQLTAYGENESGIKAAAEEADIPEAEEIIAYLLPELGADFEMEAIFTQW
jgi:hypothetical protein